MQYAMWSLAVFFAGAVGGWAVVKDGTARIIGACGCLFGGVAGIYAAVSCLLGQRNESRMEGWNAPFASLNLGLDGMSALFLVPTLLVGAMAGLSALRQPAGEYAGNRPREHWLFLNLTLASVVLALLARNALLFLFAWETMTVASFLLVENDQRDPKARGGWVYLTAGHLSAACLFALFALLGAAADRLDFSALEAGGATASAAFLLAFAGFGGKAGLFPFHAWYSESYPQSPAHVGAVLSGSVGGVAAYGLVRTLDIMASGTPPPQWWGILLVASGLASAVVGALRALAARDLSRLLAWSSVENYGLAATGVGFGLLGASTGDAMLSVLGFTAAIFHMMNHSVSKGLLFIAAGAVYARSGTRSLDRMGGLLKALPATGFLFMLGGLGAAAIPPLNGFAGEFLLLLAAYGGAVAPGRPPAVGAALLIAIGVLALAGGLAAAAFAKAFGFVFLGAPRLADSYPRGRELPGRLLPQAVLAAAALALALFAPRAIALVRPVAERLLLAWQAPGSGRALAEAWKADSPEEALTAAAFGSALIGAALLAAWAARRLLIMGKKRTTGPTWDCGYAAPDARMQYNATSFARPLSQNFASLVPLEDKLEDLTGLFPKRGAFSSSVPGLDRAWGYSHLFSLAAWLASKARLIQAGRVQIYLLYMAAVLVALLLWTL